MTCFSFPWCVNRHFIMVYDIFILWFILGIVTLLSGDQLSIFRIFLMCWTRGQWTIWGHLLSLDELFVCRLPVPDPSGSADRPVAQQKRKVSSPTHSSNGHSPSDTSPSPLKKKKKPGAVISNSKDQVGALVCSFLNLACPRWMWSTLLTFLPHEKVSKGAGILNNSTKGQNQFRLVCLPPT